ncbi:hypothetical protein J2T61_001395 [Methanocalculus sp. AMF5]|nr:hypothetical protein [Methanocalculus sp. AMF5]
MKQIDAAIVFLDPDGTILRLSRRCRSLIDRLLDEDTGI